MALTCARDALHLGWLVSGILLTLLTAQPAQAQLRAFEAIRYMALAPPMAGAERLHFDFSRWLHTRDMLVATPKQVPVGGDHRFALCSLRIDVPAPHALALECVDAQGTYVGTKRFTSLKAVTTWLAEQTDRLHVTPDARPLHTIRNVSIWQSRPPSFEKSGMSDLMELFVTDQLRTLGLTIVSTQGRPSVAKPSEDFVQFTFGFRYEFIRFSRSAYIALLDSGHRVIRSFEGSERAVWDETAAVYQRALQKAIDKFKEARLQDAEIYDLNYRLPQQIHPK
jgi:hypothetical protein